MKPEARPIPGDPDGAMMLNSTMVVELARQTDTPQAREFLDAYHAAETSIAADFPFYSEEKIRSEAVKAAFAVIGANLIPYD